MFNFLTKLFRKPKPAKLFLWKLGSLGHQVVPSDAEYQKLADIVTAHDFTTDLHLIWGPAISVEIHLLEPGDIHQVDKITFAPKPKQPFEPAYCLSGGFSPHHDGIVFKGPATFPRDLNS